MSESWHDDACEQQRKTWSPVCNVDGCRIYLPASQAHCHCGSRAFPLCEGCRNGVHTKHREKTPEGYTCACDMEVA